MADEGGHAPYTREGIRASLDTLLLGKRLDLYTQLGSTNDLAREAGHRGEPEGLAIVAEEQLAGRGRLRRAWIAPPGCCVLCSVLLRPRFPADHAFYLTAAAALAIYRAANTLSTPGGPQPKITMKWPNDVLVNGKKVAGILCESEFRAGEWDFAVVGFGINANQRPNDMGDLAPAATSLLAEFGRPIDRAALLARVLGELESIYFSLENGQFGPVYDEWAGALETIGRKVVVHEDTGVVEGQAVRVDHDGALVLRLSSGAERRVLAGDVGAV